MFKEKLSHIIEAIIQIWRSQTHKPLFWKLSILPISGVILTVVGIWVFLGIADEVLEKQTQAIDKMLMLLVKQIHSPLLDWVMRGASIIGGTIFVTLICLILGAIFWVRQQRVYFTALAITAMGGTGLNLLIKQLFDRQRPQLWQLTKSEPNTSSFPSGHAMLSLVIYGFIGYLLARHFRRWRWWIVTIIIGLIVLIGFSRVYLGIHWPTDIVAGQAAGLTWLMACLLNLEVYRHYHQHRKKSPQSLSS
ncbi:phosphatase PAP2 family protein [Coleofasciculus sp. G2-EDA-02]|uniref:phosphatase PAP2 family protein n=1 Tax=Coleofasciculus sp. G2-EDA-02 TaxID=3069529 RepID=UPI0032F2A2A5